MSKKSGPTNDTTDNAHKTGKVEGGHTEKGSFSSYNEVRALVQDGAIHKFHYRGQNDERLGSPAIGSPTKPGIERTPVANIPAWIASHDDLLASLPSHSVVAINLGTGGYVVGATGLEAMDLFEARFGLNAKAWLHRMAGPIRL
jgi:hypothetical protein